MIKNDKKCRLCGTIFNNNPFIYCDGCMDFLAELGEYRSIERRFTDNKKLKKVLTDIKIGKYDLKVK